jgi:hypothetical protein
VSHRWSSPASPGWKKRHHSDRPGRLRTAVTAERSCWLLDEAVARHASAGGSRYLRRRVSWRREHGRAASRKSA